MRTEIWFHHNVWHIYVNILTIISCIILYRSIRLTVGVTTVSFLQPACRTRCCSRLLRMVEQGALICRNMKSIRIGFIKKMKNIKKSHFHPMKKCFWYVIFTGLIMIYDEWAPHRPIISTSEVNNRSNKVSSLEILI